jgi:hypothetical protein
MTSPSSPPSDDDDLSLVAKLLLAAHKECLRDGEPSALAALARARAEIAARRSGAHQSDDLPIAA